MEGEFILFIPPICCVLLKQHQMCDFINKIYNSNVYVRPFQRHRIVFVLPTDYTDFYMLKSPVEYWDGIGSFSFISLIVFMMWDKWAWLEWTLSDWNRNEAELQWNRRGLATMLRANCINFACRWLVHTKISLIWKYFFKRKAKWKSNYTHAHTQAHTLMWNTWDGND